MRHREGYAVAYVTGAQDYDRAGLIFKVDAVDKQDMGRVESFNISGEVFRGGGADEYLEFTVSALQGFL